VVPHVHDAWIDESKTKIGYEIPFTRHFYEYTPPRPLAEIEAEIRALEDEIRGMLGEVLGSAAEHGHGSTTSLGLRSFPRAGKQQAYDASRGFAMSATARETIAFFHSQPTLAFGTSSLMMRIVFERERTWRTIGELCPTSSS
jgi:hypothetical protein